MATSLAAQAQNRAELARATRNLTAVMAATKMGTRQGMSILGVHLVNEVRKELSRPGTGRTYRRGGVVHQASAPGDAPAPDTGRYRASWTHFITDEPGGAALFVGTSSPIGGFLEFGTRRMDARPHLRPVIARNTPTVPLTLAKAITASQRATVSKLGGGLRVGLRGVGR